MRVLAAALGRHIGRRAFEHLEQSLLHALARHVARDGQVLGLAGHLVDLVDVDDADLARGISKSAAVMSLSRMFSTSSPT